MKEMPSLKVHNKINIISIIVLIINVSNSISLSNRNVAAHTVLHLKNVSMTSFTKATKLLQQNYISISPLSKNTNNDRLFKKFCDTESPTPEVWKAHNISGYIQTQSVTISQFARENGAINFVCGIGETCNALQICAPVPGPAWHVLYAVQQWNQVQESLSKAVTFASSTLNAIGSQISIDLWPPPDRKAKKLFKISMILALCVAIIATISAVLFLWLPGANFLFLGIASGAAAAVAAAQAATTIEAQRAYQKMQSDAFSRWATYTEAIESWKNSTQTEMSNSITHALSSPLNDPSGFAGLLSNGSYFTNQLNQNTYDLEKSLTDVIKARLINKILIEKRAFVTVSSDECKQGGPGGAFKMEDGWLSWCKDGKMMNVIQAHGDKVRNKIYNGVTIPVKYGITVEFMTTQSENCQKKYGGFSHDPYQDGTLPKDINSDCLFNLPVCYPSADKKIRKKRRKEGTVVACRKVGGLPI